jgi:sugar lactone lactonase YvrE
MNKLSIFFLLLVALIAKSQIVEQIPTKLLNGPDGMVIDKKGNIYIANWGKKGDGTSVVKIDKLGREQIFIDSLAAPDGLTFDRKGNLLISCFASGEIVKVDKNRRRTVMASGLDHPSDLKFNRDDVLFVTSFGNFNGRKIYTIQPDNKIQRFCRQPSGSTWSGIQQ